MNNTGEILGCVESFSFTV